MTVERIGDLLGYELSAFLVGQQTNVTIPASETVRDYASAREIKEGKSSSLFSP